MLVQSVEILFTMRIILRYFSCGVSDLKNYLSETGITFLNKVTMCKRISDGNS